MCKEYIHVIRKHYIMDIVPLGIFSEESITYNTKSVGTLDKELQQCIISVYVKEKIVGCATEVIILGVIVQ